MVGKANNLQMTIFKSLCHSKGKEDGSSNWEETTIQNLKSTQGETIFEL
jgi:hypothetical protein